ncbi:putative bifunctional diguanylate cyclase/phosphodiesterase [Desulfuromonas thiophila]|uniref:putative bifunctional diguanylate cyclase/phosphodiesterase n=1 Tax=Desulfuromonas thiophila TaxID=57664 RepID=UPI0024A9A7FE|nr:EAL domain-containing protein [Desulfuromonas thiophila]
MEHGRLARRLWRRLQHRPPTRQDAAGLRNILNSIGNGVIATDLQQRVIGLNPGAEQLTGFSPQEAIGAVLRQIFPLRHALSGQRLELPLAQVVRDGAALALEEHCQLQDRQGRLRAVAGTLAPLRDADGVPCGLVLSFHDISDDYRLRQQLRQSEQRFKEVVNSLNDNLILLDPELRVQLMNAAALNSYAVDSEHYRGRKCHELFWDCPDICANCPSLRVLQTGQPEGALRQLPDGRVLDRTIYPVRDALGRICGTAVVASDITKRHRAEQALEHQAYHDQLTGLPNRRLYLDRLEQALMRARRHRQMLAVVMLDLNRFKDINDSLGHGAGDALLVLVADRLRRQLRAEDTVARLGGDEFLVLLEDFACLDDLLAVLDKVRLTFAAPFVVEGHALHLSASIGVATWPEAGDSCEELIKNADLAMYRSKRDGGQQHCFYNEEMARLALSRIRLEADLRRGLNQDELTVYFQPKVDLVTGALVSLEALARWCHPRKGMIAPAEFIPVAEACHLIAELGEQVLRKACHQVQRWRLEGIYCGRVAVNVAAAQLRHNRLCASVAAALQESGLPPGCLCLEITETSLMQIDHQVLQELQTLRGWGVTLAIDDFGTGYSSLAYLKRLPITTLKLDKSFVDDLPSDDNSVAITRAVIGMARALGLRVVAEGVENAAQRDFLLEAGATQAQGYLWARPAPRPDFAAFAIHCRC